MFQNTPAAGLSGRGLCFGHGGQVGVQKGLGKEGYENLLAKVRPLILQSVVNEYRFLPDISYLPPATAK